MLNELDFEEYKRWLQSVELGETSVTAFLEMAATLVVNSGRDQKVVVQAQQIVGGE